MRCNSGPLSRSHGLEMIVFPIVEPRVMNHHFIPKSTPIKSGVCLFRRGTRRGCWRGERVFSVLTSNTGVSPGLAEHVCVCMCLYSLLWRWCFFFFVGRRKPCFVCLQPALTHHTHARAHHTRVVSVVLAYRAVLLARVAAGSVFTARRPAASLRACEENANA